MTGALISDLMAAVTRVVDSGLYAVEIRRVEVDLDREERFLNRVVSTFLNALEEDDMERDRR